MILSIELIDKHFCLPTVWEMAELQNLVVVCFKVLDSADFSSLFLALKSR